MPLWRNSNDYHCPLQGKLRKFHQKDISVSVIPWNMSMVRYFAFTHFPGCNISLAPWNRLCIQWWKTKHWYTWWRHQMEIFSALLAICAGNSPVPVEFPSQRPATRGFDVFFDLRLNKRLSKQSWDWWFETPVRSLWRHCSNDVTSRIWLKNDGFFLAWLVL